MLTPFANRRHAELDGVVGYFVAPFPLVTSLAGKTFAQLAASVQVRGEPVLQDAAGDGWHAGDGGSCRLRPRCGRRQPVTARLASPVLARAPTHPHPHAHTPPYSLPFKPPQEAVLDIHANQDAPLPLIMQALGATASAPPNITFVLQPANTRPPLELQGVAASRLNASHYLGSAAFDLTLELVEPAAPGAGEVPSPLQRTGAPERQARHPPPARARCKPGHWALAGPQHRCCLPAAARRHGRHAGLLHGCAGRGLRQAPGAAAGAAAGLSCGGAAGTCRHPGSPAARRAPAGALHVCRRARRRAAPGAPSPSPATGRVPAGLHAAAAARPALEPLPPVPLPPQGLTLWHMFVAAAERAWETPALLDSRGLGHALSYGSTAVAAAHLAGRLREAGVGPGVPVGLLMDRSQAHVLLILATWAVRQPGTRRAAQLRRLQCMLPRGRRVPDRSLCCPCWRTSVQAGGILVPLDPSNPVSRLCSILEQSGAPLVVTDEPQLAQRLLAELLQATPAPRVQDAGAWVAEAATVTAAAAAAGAAAHLATLRAMGPQPSDIAYLLFTSGSTGKVRCALAACTSRAAVVQLQLLALAPRVLSVWHVLRPRSPLQPKGVAMQHAAPVCTLSATISLMHQHTAHRSAPRQAKAASRTGKARAAPCC